MFCGEECESVVHVRWECPVYDTIRNTFMGKLNNLLGGVLKNLAHLIMLKNEVCFRVCMRIRTGVIFRLC